VKLDYCGEFRVLTLRELPPGDLFSQVLDTPEKTAAWYRANVASDVRYNPDIEQLHVIPLSTRRKPLGVILVSTGTLDTILVHPREVFRPAIIVNAAALIVLHNHPSGDATPSEADIKVTRDLIRGGTLLKMEVLDHVIMGDPGVTNAGGYVSLRELGYFYS
jgi:DNA repair protein RadC